MPVLGGILAVPHEPGPRRERADMGVAGPSAVASPSASPGAVAGAGHTIDTQIKVEVVLPIGHPDGTFTAVPPLHLQLVQQKRVHQRWRSPPLLFRQARRAGFPPIADVVPIRVLAVVAYYGREAVEGAGVVIVVVVVAVMMV